MPNPKQPKKKKVKAWVVVPSHLLPNLSRYQDGEMEVYLTLKSAKYWKRDYDKIIPVEISYQLPKRNKIK